MSPASKFIVTLPPLAVCLVACIAPVSLSRIENVIWLPHEVMPIMGTTFSLELPSDARSGTGDVRASCDGKSLRDGYSFGLSNAPLAYYPTRYGSVVNDGVYKNSQQDTSVFGSPFTNTYGGQ